MCVEDYVDASKANHSDKAWNCDLLKKDVLKRISELLKCSCWTFAESRFTTLWLDHRFTTSLDGNHFLFTIFASLMFILAHRKSGITVSTRLQSQSYHLWKEKKELLFVYEWAIRWLKHVIRCRLKIWWVGINISKYIR